MDKFEILYEGPSKILKINAIKGEVFNVEAGSMVAMTPTFDFKVRAGGVGKVVGRMLSGESAFLQEYTAKADGELLLAPTYLGEIKRIELDGIKEYRISNGNFLACSEGVKLETKARVKGILGTGEGIFTLKAKGIGSLFVNSCGSIHKIFLESGQEYIIDSSHLVLWDNNLKYSSEMAGKSIGKSLFSGEGFVSRFIGPGEIWIQTRKQILLGQST